MHETRREHPMNDPTPRTEQADAQAPGVRMLANPRRTRRA
jgi:hypothetical protein